MRKFIVGAGLVAASFGVAGVADAAPKPNVETFTCDGEVVDIVVAGRNGWIDGVKYQAHNLEVVGVFDPAGPAPAVEVFTDSQWTSGQTGGLQCTATEVETTPEGVFTVTISLNAIPK